MFYRVGKILFGKNKINELKDFMSCVVPVEKPKTVVVMDEIHKKTGVYDSVRARLDGLPYEFIFLNMKSDPTTQEVDNLKNHIAEKLFTPDLLIAVGGGAILDMTKAASVMLTNSGSSEDYQGWNLVKNKPVAKIGIPTIFGSGAEASKSAVLTGSKKKLGINSAYSLFDGIIIDPETAASVPVETKVLTAFDCFTHAFEALNGTMTNTPGKSLARAAIELCGKFFENIDDNEPIAAASSMALEAAANGETGVVHAMSYGLSFVLGMKHSVANCVVLNKLEGIGFYDKYIEFYKDIAGKYSIPLPHGVCARLPEKDVDKMAEVAAGMKNPLINALGAQWEKILPPQKIKNLFAAM